MNHDGASLIIDAEKKLRNNQPFILYANIQRPGKIAGCLCASLAKTFGFNLIMLV